MAVSGVGNSGFILFYLIFVEKKDYGILTSARDFCMKSFKIIVMIYLFSSYVLNILFLRKHS